MKHIYQAWQVFWKPNKKNTQTRITVLLFSILFSSFVYGQNLPIVVDNIEFFPPARNQQNVPDCSYFSLIYYLKSYEWNKHFNRNPKLERNQFSHSFAWNQSIDPEYQISDPLCAVYFMKNQGCATIADFPLTETSTDIQPSVEVKTKALAYKSKRLFPGNFHANWPDEMIKNSIESLKDSLAYGKCFSLSFRLFDSFMKLSSKNNVFSCYPGTSVDSIRQAHIATVIGYNDTIKTASGRGAFMVIDSNTDLISNGIFYFDYKWFYSGVFDFYYFFLEEDFSSQAPEIVMSINLSGALTRKDMANGEYLFVDTLINSKDTKVVFDNPYDYLFYRNQVQVVSINGSKNKLRKNLLYFPLNNSDGDYNLLTDLSLVDNLKSLSIIIFDPISAEYIGANGETPYAYARGTSIQVNKAEIDFLGTGKRINAKVVDLSDTTIVANEFYFNQMGFHWPHIIGFPFVKSCTSVLKRQMITFTLEETETSKYIDVTECSLSVYPNPVADMATFEILLPKRETVQLKIFNSHGQQVAEIDNREFEAGSHRLVFDSKGLQDGIYICSLKTSAGIKTVKLIKNSGLN